MLTAEERAMWRARLLAACEPDPKPKPPAEVVKLVPKKPDPVKAAIRATFSQ